MKNLIISLLLVGQVFAQTTKYHKIITTPSHDYFYLRVGDFNADSVMKPKNILFKKMTLRLRGWKGIYGIYTLPIIITKYNNQNYMEWYDLENPLLDYPEMLIQQQPLYLK